LRNATRWLKRDETMSKSYEDRAALARLKALPPAPAGQTYVVVTLAFDSHHERLLDSDAVLSWVEQHALQPERESTARRDRMLEAGLLTQDEYDTLDGLLTVIGVVGPLPVELAGSGDGLVAVRLRLARAAMLRATERHYVPSAPPGELN
jgi:hypothetical protein